MISLFAQLLVLIGTYERDAASFAWYSLDWCRGLSECADHASPCQARVDCLSCCFSSAIRIYSCCHTAPSKLPIYTLAGRRRRVVIISPTIDKELSARKDDRHPAGSVWSVLTDFFHWMISDSFGGRRHFEPYLIFDSDLDYLYYQYGQSIDGLDGGSGLYYFLVTMRVVSYFFLQSQSLSDHDDLCLGYVIAGFFPLTLPSGHSLFRTRYCLSSSRSVCLTSLKMETAVACHPTVILVYRLQIPFFSHYQACLSNSPTDRNRAPTSVWRTSRNLVGDLWNLDDFLMISLLLSIGHWGVLLDRMLVWWFSRSDWGLGHIVLC